MLLDFRKKLSAVCAANLYCVINGGEFHTTLGNIFKTYIYHRSDNLYDTTDNLFRSTLSHIFGSI